MNSKTITRISHISNNAFRQVLASAINMVVPLMVVSYTSKTLWGSMVPLLLFSLMAIQIINWGNKEFLLREFSRMPNKIKICYSQNAMTRLPLFIMAAIAGILWFGFSLGIFITLWLLGRFFIHTAEPLVIYEKRFSVSIVIEIGSFILFCLAFFLAGSDMDLWLLTAIYSLYQLVKGIALFLVFSPFFTFGGIKPDKSYFKLALPFFLLSVLGFLASKVDVYIITRFGDAQTLSDYQIINSLLVFIMSLSAFIYAPFTKNIYRNTEAVIDKTRKLLLISGIIVVPFALIAFHLLLKFYLHLQLPLLFYAIASAYVFPVFVYGIEVVDLFRIQREKTVVAYLFIGAVFNTGLSALFLYNGYGMTGALAGSAIAQAVALVLFKSKWQLEK